MKKFFKLMFLNVKIVSPTRSGDQAYIDIFTFISNRDNKMPYVKIRGDAYATLTKTFKREDETGIFFYGKIAKFTNVDPKSQWLNTISLEPTNYYLPDNLHPNLVQADYIFVPAAHRIGILINDKLSINTSKICFEEILKKVINEDETIEVIIETSKDAISEILEADELRRLKVDLTYSNSDMGADFEQVLDEQLKDAKAGRVSLEINKGNNGALNKDNDLIQGALKLSLSNGTVDATVYNDGKIKKIKSKDYPNCTKFALDEKHDLVANVRDKIMSMFRKRNNGSNYNV